MLFQSSDVWNQEREKIVNRDRSAEVKKEIKDSLVSFSRNKYKNKNLWCIKSRSRKEC